MSKVKPFIITGYIGSGKSTIAQHLNKHYNVSIIDTDIVVRQLQQSGQPCFNAMVELLGHQIIGPDGELNRKVVASIVFSDKEKLQQLNACIHPAVYAALDNELERFNSNQEQQIGLPPGCTMLSKPSYVALVIPLYFEAGHTLYMPVINIGVSDRKSLEERIRLRDGENSLKRLKSQLPLEEREQKASLAIRNDNKNDIDVYCRQIIDFVNK